MKNNHIFILCTCCVILFFSCEDKDQINGAVIEPPQDEYISSDLNPDGDNLGHIGNLYFNLAGEDAYNQEFWKFNYFHLTGGAHNGPDDGGIPDALTLTTYNNSYYVPPESFDSDCCDDDAIVYVYNEDYDPTDPLSEQYIISDDYDELSDLTTEITEDVTAIVVDEILNLKTPALSTNDALEDMIWSIGENMYSFSTMSQIKDTLLVDYSYNYNLKNNFVPLDTVLNPPIDNFIVIIDPGEISEDIRAYDIYDTLQVEGQEDFPVLINREYTFYSYRNELNHNFGQRESTDCNDNYQKDTAETTMSNFESNCLGEWIGNSSDACSSYCDDDESLTMNDLCWNLALDDSRLTAHCVEDSNIGAFCDYGNNLQGGEEILYDACVGDCDGENGDIDVIGQGVEPFEDRNCNGIYDQNSEETLFSLNEEDCNLQYGSWNESIGTCFKDEGNGQWDDAEACYGDLETCNYMALYKKGIAPNSLLVSYVNQSSPIPLINVFAGDVYKDCGTDLECNEEEDDFSPGLCDDGYSGTEELCCKHNMCWNYDAQVCDFTQNDCLYENGESNSIWEDNLDPSSDDFPLGGERNFQYDVGESILKDFDGNGQYSTPTQITTKFLSYEGCIEGNSSCGGEAFDVISDDFEIAVASSAIQKEESKVEVESYSIIGQLPLSISNLNELNIIKTEWPNTDEIDGFSEDYMLFMDSASDDQDQSGMHYIIKMIQPYYYYANTPYSGVFENLPDQWWQTVEWEQDTLMYSLDGSVIDGQKFYSSYSVESDTANYVIHKEYEVSTANAEMVYSPTVENCILITRTITTTMLGPAINFKIKSETYLKEGYPIVKEDVYWSWPPIFEGDRIFVKTSAIEYHQEIESVYSNNNLFNNIEPVDLNELQNNEDFNFEPFKLSNTMGLQRVVIPE